MLVRINDGYVIIDLMKAMFLLLIVTLSSCSSKSWRDASRESANIAPKAEELKEDIVLIYHARAFKWRGYFGVHPWISFKRKSDSSYTVAQVTAWNIHYQGSAIRYEQDLPDRKWFDSHPHLLFEARGEKATRIIEQVEELIKSYPYKDRYRVFPGPNSNSFISYLIRNIDEIDEELPPTAIGKDYLEPGTFLTNTPSNTGFTLSLYGLLGLTCGLYEGIEINLFGLHFGIDFVYPGIKLPFIGRIGF